MTDHEVERALGYTPCVCGIIDGTWHSACYRNKTQAQLDAGHKSAMRNARAYLKDQRAAEAATAIAKVRGVTAPPTGQS